MELHGLRTGANESWDHLSLTGLILPAQNSHAKEPFGWKCCWLVRKDVCKDLLKGWRFRHAADLGSGKDVPAIAVLYNPRERGGGNVDLVGNPKFEKSVLGCIGAGLCN